MKEGNLHLTNAAFEVLKAGEPHPEVVEDIDGQIRPQNSNVTSAQINTLVQPLMSVWNPRIEERHFPHHRTESVFLCVTRALDYKMC